MFKELYSGRISLGASILADKAAWIGEEHVIFIIIFPKIYKNIEQYRGNMRKSKE